MTFDENRVRAALWKSWSRDSAVQWTKERPFDGQCNVTAAVIADVFGAEILSTPWNEITDHYYNRIDGVTYDLTDEQFDEPVQYADTPSSHETASQGFSAAEFEALKTAFLKNMEFEA